MKKIYTQKANPVSTKKVLVMLGCLVEKSIKNQYRRSMLGVVWTVLNPLLNMLVMAFVFSNLFGRKGIIMDYPVYVLSGHIVFGLMRSATTMAMPSLVGNYDLMSKTRTPYFVFPLSNVITAVVNFGFSLIALILVMVVRISKGVRFYWTSLMIFIPWLPMIFLFSAGLAFLLAVVYVRFRDIKHIYGVFLTLWMYLTPVFYDLEALNLKSEYVTILKINPMYHYLKFFRETLLGNVPGWRTWVVCLGAGILSFALGMIVFKLLKKKLIFYI